MEYADILSSKSTHGVSTVDYPSPYALVLMCTQQTIEQRRACFRYFPRIQRELVTKNDVLIETQSSLFDQTCRSFANFADRSACFAGIGVSNAHLLFTNSEAAHARCEGLSSHADQASCTLGMISSAAEYRQPATITMYCRNIVHSVLREYCFQVLFAVMNQLGMSDLRKSSVGSTSALGNICGTTMDPLCLMGFGEDIEDPWAAIRTRFPETTPI